jgi:hypothetical protein
VLGVLIGQFGVLDLMLSNAKIPSVNFSGDEQNERIAQTVGRNWKSEETAWIYNYNVGPCAGCLIL